jgi:hypothetical protein
MALHVHTWMCKIFGREFTLSTKTWRSSRTFSLSKYMSKGIQGPHKANASLTSNLPIPSHCSLCQDTRSRVSLLISTKYPFLPVLEAITLTYFEPSN